METPQKTNTGLFLSGLALAFISYCILLVPDTKALRSSDIFDDGSIFFINYGISILYLIIILVNNFGENGFRFYRLDFKLFAVSLLLFTISGFSLNLSMGLFSEFTTWMKWYLGLMQIALLGLCFIDERPTPVKSFLFFLAGISFIMAFYFTILMLNILPFAIIGCFFFGISLHGLLPLFWSITYLVQFIKKKNSTAHAFSFLAGCTLPFVFMVAFVYKWNETKQLIHEANAAIITRPDNSLPKWVLLSQVLPNDFFTERIIKGSLCYDSWDWDDFGFNRGRNSFSEMKKHDPLVLIGMGYKDKLSLTEDERIKILQSKFDARHASQRKLWSGENLVTEEVLTNIQVFPDYRLAYIEKIISIKNISRRNWGTTEEAAYTFHLPEGSVATSLSLWINGIEEKSRLTTKGKADSAYVSIVGVERRDPALLHWQEGNTLTVTVFPCTPEESRRFKIGITIPLEKKEEKIVLKNVYFEGPEIKDALETTVIEFVTQQSFTIPKLPGEYNLTGDKKYQFTGKYKPYWEIEMNATPLSQEPFTFNNKSFTVQPLAQESENFEPTAIYLDINKSWSKQEFDEVWSSVNQRNVFVYYDNAIKLTDENHEEMFALLQKQNFSLFPFHKISTPASTLVISKSPGYSPNLADIKGSEFFKDMKTAIATSEIPRLFSLTKELSPYLKTLKEYHVFHADFVDTKKLNQQLVEKIFPKQNANENVVELDMAEIQIVCDSTGDSVSTSSAPDHLMRMFAYNQILKKIGTDYFTQKEYVTDELIAIANEAYVVSPISSLIVLETIKDYERFGIDENRNSLKNASTKSSGAVPEPHEWVLIIFVLCMLTWMYFRSATKSEA